MKPKPPKPPKPRALVSQLPAQYSELYDEALAAEDTTGRRWLRRLVIDELERRAAARAAGRAPRRLPLIPVSSSRRAERAG